MNHCFELHGLGQLDRPFGFSQYKGAERHTHLQVATVDRANSMPDVGFMGSIALNSEACCPGLKEIPVLPNSFEAPAACRTKNHCASDKSPIRPVSHSLSLSVYLEKVFLTINSPLMCFLQIKHSRGLLPLLEIRPIGPIHPPGPEGNYFSVSFVFYFLLIISDFSFLSWLTPPCGYLSPPCAGHSDNK